MPDAKQLTRIQFEMDIQKVQDIDELVEQGSFESRKDLLNNAITLLKWAIRHVEAGHVVAAVDEPTERYFELEMPFLQHVAAKRNRKGRAAY